MNPFAGLGQARPAEPEKPRRQHGRKPPQTGWIAPIPNPWKLTGIQCEILKRLGNGESAKTIAAEFGLSPKTIDAHAYRARVKMAAESRTQAVVMWAKHTAGEKT